MLVALNNSWIRSLWSLGCDRILDNGRPIQGFARPRFIEEATKSKPDRPGRTRVRSRRRRGSVACWRAELVGTSRDLRCIGTSTTFQGGRCRGRCDRSRLVIHFWTYIVARGAIVHAFFVARNEELDEIVGSFIAIGTWTFCSIRQTGSLPAAKAILKKQKIVMSGNKYKVRNQLECNKIPTYRVETVAARHSTSDVVTRFG